MTPRDRRRARRAIIDLGILALIFAGAVWVAVMVMEITAHQLANEYSAFNFYPPEEQ